MEDAEESVPRAGEDDVASVQENIRAVLRIRPVKSDVQRVVSRDAVDSCLVRIASRNQKGHLEFRLSHVFDEQASQSDVYAYVQPSLEGLLRGVNTTIFAYGQTGTGKTYTMLGKGLENQLLADKSQDVYSADGAYDTAVEDLSPGGLREKDAGWGLIPRAVRELFSRLSSVQAVTVHCSYMQIYQDKLFDLLRDKKRQKPLAIRETMSNGTKSVFVQGLSEFRVTGAEDVFVLLAQGTRSRVQRSTDFNDTSSRSHAVLQLSVELEFPEGGRGRRVIRRAKLNLVDLAGSEKWGERNLTKNAGGSLEAKELRTINTSLSALGNCISALLEKNRSHIPYRDSALTRLLQDSLGGSTRTIIIATIDPSANSQEESASTLQFANRATQITARLRVNEVVNDAVLLQRAKREIDRLRALLAEQQLKLDDVSSTKSALPAQAATERLEREVVEWKSKYDDLLAFHTQQSKIIQIHEVGKEFEPAQNSAHRPLYSLDSLCERCSSLERQLKQEEEKRALLEKLLATLEVASAKEDLKLRSSTSSHCSASRNHSQLSSRNPSRSSSRPISRNGSQNLAVSVRSDDSGGSEEDWLIQVNSPIVAVPKPTTALKIPKITMSPKRLEEENAEFSGENIVKAVFDFIGEQEGDLKFFAGQLIRVEEKNEDGWWLGYLKDDPLKKAGSFPSNFVKIGPESGIKDYNPTVTAHTLNTICNRSKRSRCPTVEQPLVSSRRESRVKEILEADRVSTLDCSRLALPLKMPVVEDSPMRPEVDSDKTSPKTCHLTAVEEDGKCERHGLIKCLLCSMTNSFIPKQIPKKSLFQIPAPHTEGLFVQRNDDTDANMVQKCERHGLQSCVLCSLPSFNGAVSSGNQSGPQYTLASPLDAYRKSRHKNDAFPLHSDSSLFSPSNKGVLGAVSEGQCSRHGLFQCLLCSLNGVSGHDGPIQRRLTTPVPCERKIDQSPSSPDNEWEFSHTSQDFKTNTPGECSKPSYMLSGENQARPSDFEGHASGANKSTINQISPRIVKRGMFNKKHDRPVSYQKKATLNADSTIYASVKEVRQEGQKGNSSKMLSSIYNVGLTKQSSDIPWKPQKKGSQQSVNVTVKGSRLPKLIPAVNKEPTENDAKSLYLAKQAMLAASALLNDNNA